MEHWSVGVPRKTGLSIKPDLHYSFVYGPRSHGAMEDWSVGVSAPVALLPSINPELHYSFVSTVGAMEDWSAGVSAPVALLPSINPELHYSFVYGPRSHGAMEYWSFNPHGTPMLH